jgi:Ni,Fe-hydrogenase I cytochrome b subunit
MDPCSHGSIWNGQNYLRNCVKKDILGKLFVYQPYLTCIMHNPCRNLPVSTWFLLYGSMLTHGILLEWSKYLKKITKVKYFRQAITIPTMSNQYHTKSMWKIACFHMVFAK